MILDKIVTYKKKKIEEEKKNISMDKLILQINNPSVTRDFKQSIKVENQLSRRCTHCTKPSN